MRLALPLLAGLLLFALPARAENPVVRFTTVLGSYDVELCAETSTACPGVAPNTVANFLRYVDEGRYPETMYVHRRGAGGNSPLVIQSGAFWIDRTGPYTERVTTFAPIALEVGTGLSNLRGTIAMARGQLPDTATSQWFINLVDNTSLDTASGGYAVFGKVVGGIDVIDAIGALTIYNANPPNCQFTVLGCAFGELPLLATYPGGAAVDYLVYVTDIARVVPEPGSVASAAVALLAVAARARRHAR